VIKAASKKAPWLVADVGGTNARFALVTSPKGTPEEIFVYTVADFPNLADAAQKYIDEHAKGAKPSAACVAVAGPVIGDRFKLTNSHWDFSVEETKTALGLDAMFLVNDFTALARSLPRLKASDLKQIGGGTAEEGQAMAVVGAGTGLGVGGLLPVGGRWIPIPGEGGHVDLSPVTGREMRLASALISDQGAVTGECVLSGGGLERVYRLLTSFDGASKTLSAAEITEAGLGKGDPHARETLNVFCAILGGLAGNVAVTLGARGGVYIGGGIAPRIADFLSRSQFRPRFENKYRMVEYAKRIPTFLILAATPALDGAAAWLDDQLEFTA
jgi:glucokinase